MTTDDKDKTTIEEKTNDETTKTGNNEPEVKENKEVELSDTEKALVDRMTQVFETKLSETIDKYDKEITELKKSVDNKDKEIAKLRKVNSEILMSTDLTGKNKDDIDFNEADFDDVDWDSQVKATLDKIDKKIS